MVVALTAAGGTITLLIGTVLLRLTVTGTYRRYVRVGMGPWLAVAGCALVLLGVLTLVRVIRRDRSDADPIHDHGAGWVGWLLLAPIAALLLVAPPTLGSFGIERGATVDVRAGPAVFEPLRGAGPFPMTLLEFGQRAFEHAGASLANATVSLTGFVVAPGAGGFELARYQIACCAADATPVVVRVTGVFGDVPPADQWVRVTGRSGSVDGDIPELVATSVVEIATPDDPYE
jgi:uncharacterized repeat protein (TIGR03943 family)